MTNPTSGAGERRYRTPRLLPVVLSVAAVLCGAAASAGTMTPDLKEALVFAGPDDFVPVVVMMEEFPSLDERLLEIRPMNRENRRTHVVGTMKRLAERSQTPVHAVLRAWPDEARRVRVLWGINGVALDATPHLIRSLVAIPEVRWVTHDTGSGRPASGGTGGDVSGPNPDATVRGEIIAMGAKQVWDELGYTGAGVIVAVIDTGVYRDHPDLADHIWTNLDEIAGNGIDDDDNGHIDDTWGWDFCNQDNDPTSGSHGTQVAGQVAGDGTNGTLTGMAPDAELMVIGIDCAPPDSIGWQASDYAIENGADIITESYIWPWTEDTPDFEGWRRQTDSQLAAGIIHASAAGNDGDDPSLAVPYNVSTPANCPPPWLHPDQTLVGGLSSTVTVANVSWSNDTIAPSSSRGPSAWEDIVAYTNPGYPFPLTPEYMDYPYENGANMGLLKPDVAAYGNGTYTTCPGTGYCSFSGTSSATPHVAGTFALMLQSNPEATPAELAEAVMTTTQHRGDPGKNNVYGTGLIQAYPAVLAVESTLVYGSHAIDDTDGGNGDLALDPGERVVLSVQVESRTDADVTGMEAILSTTTPGVTVHEQYATYPTVRARGSATSDAPHFSFSVAPGTCTTLIEFDLELRYADKIRRSVFRVRVGDYSAVSLLDDDFETDLGWTADPGTASDGFWVRQDPNGKFDSQNRPTNPEDDASDPGVTCWVTGNGSGGNADADDVDDGEVVLISPPFGEPNMLSLDLSYNRWFYDNQSSGNSLWVEVSNDGGLSWSVVEQTVFGYGGWQPKTADLFALLPTSDDMRLRVVVKDNGDDGTVEGAIDDVRIDAEWVDCQDYTPTTALPPNAVSDTLVVDPDPSGHAVLTWTAPPADGGHDPATVYRIERSTFPAGPFVEVGSATLPYWIDVDALDSPESFLYRVTATNSGGTE